MQPGRARTSALAVPSLLLPQYVRWVSPIGLTHWLFCVVTCLLAALGVCVCVQYPGLLALAHQCAGPVWCVLGVRRVRCSWPLRSLTGVCAMCAVCMMYLAPLGLPCFVPLFCLATQVFFCFCVPCGCSFLFSDFLHPFLEKREKTGNRVCVHHRHRHGLRVAVLESSLWVVLFLLLAGCWRLHPSSAARLSSVRGVGQRGSACVF